MLGAVLAVTQVQVDVNALSMISGTFLPLIVGLITKAKANATLKSVLLALLSAVAGVVAIWLKADGHIDVYTSAQTLIVTFVTAVAVHYGFWKPTGVTGAVNNATRNFGIGSGTPSGTYPAGTADTDANTTVV